MTIIWGLFVGPNKNIRRYDNNIIYSFVLRDALVKVRNEQLFLHSGKFKWLSTKLAKG